MQGGKMQGGKMQVGKMQGGSEKLNKKAVSSESLESFGGNGFVALEGEKQIKPPVIKKRERNSHKGSYKTAFSLCGSYGMPGAAVMSSMAALRSGIGIMKTAVIKENYEILARSVPESVLVPLESFNGKYSMSAINTISSQIKTADALLIGCGMGVSNDTAYLTRETALRSHSPVIIDADGINAVASDIEFIKQMKAPLILTPHPGEMSRLVKRSVPEIEANRTEIAREFATGYGVWLVLKGSNTVVATPSGEVFINQTGNPGMATGGSGDVLSGIMLTLVAQYDDITSAVCDAVWIHGAAGDRAAEKLSEISLLPRDILNELPSLFKTE